MSGPQSVFITGCSRGLGLELVRQFLKRPSPPAHVFASCRDPASAKDLQALASSNSNLHILQQDVTDYSRLPELVEQVKSTVGENGLNLLINNAGVLVNQVIGEVDPQVMRNSYEINAIAPIMITQAFLPLLKQASSHGSGDEMSWSRAAIINMSTKVASCGDNSSGRLFPYRTSKAALNIATVSLSVNLKEFGIMAVVLHPGWVKTDMGGPRALTATEDSIAGLMSVMEGLNASKNGLFIDFKNQIIPW